MAEKTTKKVVKKTTVKKADASTVTSHKYNCDKACVCGENCKCRKHCCGFWKKLIVVLVFFALGFVTAKMIPCPKRARMPRPQFDDNGCLVVKCQKMLEKMPEIDTNNDGCVDKAEFKAFRNTMREPMPAPQVPVAPVAE